MTAPALKGEKDSFLSFSSSSTFWCYIESHFKLPHERLGFIIGKNFPENLGWFNGRQLHILTWLNVAFPFVVPLDFLRALRWIFCVVGSVTSCPAPPSGMKLHTPPSDRGAGSWVILLLRALGHSSDLTQTTSSSRGIPHAVTGHHKGGKVRAPQHQLGEVLAVPPQSYPPQGCWALPVPVSQLAFSATQVGFCSLPGTWGCDPKNISSSISWVLIPIQSQLPRTLSPCAAARRTLWSYLLIFLQVNVFGEIEKSEPIVTVQISDFSPSSHPTPHRTLKRKQNVTGGQESPPLRIYLFWLLTQFGPSLDLI